MELPGSLKATRHERERESERESERNEDVCYALFLFAFNSIFHFTGK